MGHKQRGYKREMPERLRNYKLFAIACEGKRLNRNISICSNIFQKKIKVDVIEDYVSEDEKYREHEYKSAPHWV